jgi:hypothetical protein
MHSMDTCIRLGKAKAAKEWKNRKMKKKKKTKTEKMKIVWGKVKQQVLLCHARFARKHILFILSPEIFVGQNKFRFQWNNLKMTC